jgi:tetratricopeptide (TPR) repeat protein
MQEDQPSHLPRAARAPTSGRTPVIVSIALVLAIAAALTVLYKPWNPILYGRAQPPLPSSSDLEPPLAQRLEERIAAVRAKPYDARVWGMLGETYDVHEIYPQAIECFERAEKLDPKNPRWPYLLGLAQRIGDQKAALKCFERAIALAPDMAAAHFFAGHGYLQSERFDDAEREFTRAQELQADVPATLIGLAKVAQSKQDPKRALEFLERAMKHNPATQEARWLTAAAWRALGDEKQASQFANAGAPPPAQETYPDQLRAEELSREGVTLRFARTRAELLIARKNPDEAVKEITRYLDQVPTSALALIALGDVYLQIGKPEEAITRYQAALSIDPTQAGALGSLSTALARTGQRDEAIAKLRQAIALEPGRVEFKSGLAAMLAESSDKAEREESLALMLEVSTARPEDIATWVNLAQAQGANGHADEAMAAFQHALQLAPDEVGLRHQYGVLCARVGKLEAAAEAFAAVVKAQPSQNEARANLIHALTSLGRYPEIVTALREAHELSPASVQWRAQLAWMLATVPDDASRSGAEALTLARELDKATEGKNPEFLVILGAAQAETGDLASAKTSIEAALELMKPKGKEPMAEDKYTNIIARALGCRKAFAAGTAYRLEKP